MSMEVNSCIRTVFVVCVCEYGDKQFVSGLLNVLCLL